MFDEMIDEINENFEFDLSCPEFEFDGAWVKEEVIKEKEEITA